MTLSDYRKTLVWRDSLELGAQLVRLSEQLPQSEVAGLGAVLRTHAIEIPGSIATDLVSGTTTALGCVLRTVAALEIIEHVYPALDTAAPRAAADELATRIQGPDFAAQEAPAPAAAAVTVEPEPAVQTAGETDVVHPDSPQ